MIRDPRLEAYLSSLETALKPFPVSDRAEIITEIKSHVLDALERDPNINLEVVLSALGEPEIVANRYLLERGLQTAKPPISPIVKWLVMGFLGTVAMVLIFTAFLAVYFAPMFTADQHAGRDRLLATMDNFFENGPNVASQRGSKALGEKKAVVVNFSNGMFDITTASGSDFDWKCRGIGIEAIQADTRPDAITLDLTQLKGVKCAFAIPAGAQFTIEGSNGKIDFDEPRFHVQAKVANGKIDFSPDDDAPYRYDVSAVNGRTDSFVSSSAADAYVVTLSVINGTISQ